MKSRIHIGENKINGGTYIVKEFTSFWVIANYNRHFKKAKNNAYIQEIPDLMELRIKDPTTA